MSRPSDPPPLPGPLKRSAERLRRRRPPADVERRLDGALARAGGARHESRAWWLLVPTAAVVALALHVSTHEPVIDEAGLIHRYEERHIAASDTGETWVHLDLWTHRHADEAATVHVTAPDALDLRVGDPGRVVAPHGCEEQVCRHRFVREPGGPPEAPVRVRVPGPGRYELTVEHASSDRRIREQFVLHAR